MCFSKFVFVPGQLDRGLVTPWIWQETQSKDLHFLIQHEVTFCFLFLAVPSVSSSDSDDSAISSSAFLTSMTWGFGATGVSGMYDSMDTGWTFLPRSWKFTRKTLEENYAYLSKRELSLRLWYKTIIIITICEVQEYMPSVYIKYCENQNEFLLIYLGNHVETTSSWLTKRWLTHKNDGLTTFSSESSGFPSICICQKMRIV